ncbi:MAG: hypothetical protein CBB87_10760 [Micavibrio sp. TMED27]|nr:hypothetical protein [Micavibrio sp.]OUT90002.1 MAG: hypothetical protein CBB87_10760 [Micavibrio sp. TMED27]|tara:strand:+ start:319 stop:648 length:330 start_codon:yes stop_codon:yes gene_type:complete
MDNHNDIAKYGAAFAAYMSKEYGGDDYQRDISNVINNLGVALGDRDTNTIKEFIESDEFKNGLKEYLEGAGIEDVDLNRIDDIIKDISNKLTEPETAFNNNLSLSPQIA